MLQELYSNTYAFRNLPTVLLTIIHSYEYNNNKQQQNKTTTCKPTREEVERGRLGEETDSRNHFKGVTMREGAAKTSSRPARLKSVLRISRKRRRAWEMARSEVS